MIAGVTVYSVMSSSWAALAGRDWQLPKGAHVMVGALLRRAWKLGGVKSLGMKGCQSRDGLGNDHTE